MACGVFKSKALMVLTVCLSVRLAACLFDSLAALYLFVSARICSPPRTPILNLPLCSKPITSSHLSHLGLPPLLEKDLATPRPKQEVLLVSFGMCCVWLSPGALCFLMYTCASHSLLELSKQPQHWSFY